MTKKKTTKKKTTAKAAEKAAATKKPDKVAEKKVKLAEETKQRAMQAMHGSGGESGCKMPMSQARKYLLENVGSVLGIRHAEPGQERVVTFAETETELKSRLAEVRK